jgi:hypothetical protein
MSRQARPSLLPEVVFLNKLKLDLTSCQNFELACVIRDTYLEYLVLSIVVRRHIHKYCLGTLRREVGSGWLAIAVQW